MKPDLFGQLKWFICFYQKIFAVKVKKSYLMHMHLHLSCLSATWNALENPNKTRKQSFLSTLILTQGLYNTPGVIVLYCCLFYVFRSQLMWWWVYFMRKNSSTQLISFKTACVNCEFLRKTWPRWWRSGLKRWSR